MPPTPRNGSTREWRRLRTLVLTRDHHTCHRPDPATGQACGRPATTAGHIIDRALGGTNSLDNLRAECTACNYAAGARLVALLRRLRS